MPTYQYACTACDHRFEAVQSFSDDSLTVCPECGGPLRKVFSSVGIVFKGSGFYRTDSRGSSNGVAASSSESKSDSSSSTSSSSDSGSTPQTVSGKPPKHGELVKTSGPNSASSSSSSSGSSPAA